MSKTAPSCQFINNSNYGYLYDPYNNAKVQIGARYYHYLGSDHAYGNTVILHYIPDLDIWELSLSFQADSKVGDDILIGYESTYTYSSTDVEKKTVYTNAWSPAKLNGYLTFNVNTSLPSDIPEINIGLPDINAEINNALNATTSTTTQANYIQEMINVNLDQYNQGNITLNDMKTILEGTSSMLDSLSNQTGNTLSDQIAINNAQNTINNAQNALQIEQDNELSQAIIERITSIWQLSPEMANYANLLTDLERVVRQFWIQPYFNGDLTKDQVLIYGTDTLPSLLEIRSGEIDIMLSECSTQADFEFVSQMKDMLDTAIDVINNAGDFDKEVADKLESSDNEELVYLDSAISETTKDIDGLKSDLDDVISNSQANQVKTGILQPILNNKLIKSLLPIAALFMVLAVTLGVRYRL